MSTNRYPLNRRNVRLSAWIAAVLLLCGARDAATQPAKWEIIDNSFLVEESFNQERGVFQNIFTWTRVRAGSWQASFTQEWPVLGITHQLSYTIPFAKLDDARGLNDVLLNYRYQLFEESARRPAVSPRISLILPTGSEAGGLGDGTGGLQINVPMSKQLGRFYLHGNGGVTWLANVSSTPFAAGSVIWRTSRTLNVLLEVVGEIGDSFTVSPGFRRAWTFGERQIVGGLALPITRSDARNQVALLTYFSYELPFR
jgi:Putative MetA-pathway of phenol degradation